jgi:hypothetical protein
MEPLAALAVSCNIIELVVIAGKTCRLIKQVLENKALPAHEELTSSISLLEKNVGALDVSLKDFQNTSQLIIPGDKELLGLAQNCRRLGVDLKQKLDALQVKDSDTKSDKTGKLLQTVLQRSKIYDLQRRWEELRKAVDTALLVRNT